MISPGRDDNYPTSSGDFGAAKMGFLGKSFSIDGMSISVGLLVLVIVALIMWGILKK